MDEKGHVNIYSRPLHDFSIENSTPLLNLKLLMRFQDVLNDDTQPLNMGDRRGREAPQKNLCKIKKKCSKLGEKM